MRVAIWNDRLTDWRPVTSRDGYFKTYVPLEYKSEYLNRLETEESVVEYETVNSRKSSISSALSTDPFGSLETIKSEITYAIKGESDTVI